MGREIDFAWYIESILELGITIIGILFCWRINGGNNGPDFVLRVVCLAVPAGIIITILGFALGFVLRFTVPYLYAYLPLDPFISYYTVIFCQFVILSALYWLIIGLSLKRISDGRAHKSSAS